MSELLTAEQVLKMLESFVCDCGFRLTDSDLCFAKIDDGYLYKCPRCGDQWKLEVAKVN